MAESAETPQNPGPCVRCAERFGSCCTLTPGQEEFCFPLSDAERAGMVSAGAQAQHFAAQENTAAFVDNLCRLFPGEDAALKALFPLGGTHMRLAITAKGACRLLGGTGCVLPRAARPIYCLLYPFWLRSGQIMYFEYDRCQALLEGRCAGPLMRRLGVTESEIRQLHRDLRAAWSLR